MSKINRSYILRLYRSLLRESNKFDSYNFRNYAVRKIRETFRTNKLMSNSDAILEQIGEAEKNLEVIKRQVLIGNLYATDKLVIENLNKNRH